MKSILNNKKAEIGYAKIMWAILVMSLVFGIYMEVFNDWGSELAASQGAEGVNISTQTNSSFKITRSIFEEMKTDVGESEQKLLEEEKETGSWGITFKGGIAAMNNVRKSITNFPRILWELLMWLTIPEWVLGVIATMFGLVILIVIIKAFVTKGQEV